MTPDARAPFIIAIDGPSAAGKSTVARLVAERLGLPYLDSGALYRTVALAALEAGVGLEVGDAVARVAAGLDIEPIDGGTRVLLAGQDVTGRLRSFEVSEAASRVSAVAGVRQVLRELQRAAVADYGAVAEGRDMGTVIFPNAALKVFLDAEPGERARRRAAERSQPPSGVEAVGRELARRDRRDRDRKVAPLEVAPDAVRIDSTTLNIEEVVASIIAKATELGFSAEKKF